MMRLMLSEVRVNEHILEDAKYKYLFSVEVVNELVNTGIPFRDAYQQVGDQIQQGNFQYIQKKLQHTHQGSIGNLCNSEISRRMQSVMHRFN